MMPCHISDERVRGDPQDAPDYPTEPFTVYVLCDDGDEAVITINACDYEDAEELALHDAEYRMLRPIKVLECWRESEREVAMRQMRCAGDE